MTDQRLKYRVFLCLIDSILKIIRRAFNFFFILKEIVFLKNVYPIITSTKGLEN